MTLQEFQSTIKYNPAMLEAFLKANDIDLDSAMQKAEREYNKRLATPKKADKENTKVNTIVNKNVNKRRSVKQKRADIVVKDRMRIAKDDMIHHIEVLIKSGDLDYWQFIQDPTVYLDAQIMGSYYNNYVIRKAIIRYFEKEFIPF